MTGSDASTGERAWSQKVNPKRAQAEADQAQHQQGAQALFHELFGAPDAGLMAELQDSMNRAAAIGNAWIDAAEEDIKETSAKEEA